MHVSMFGGIEAEYTKADLEVTVRGDEYDSNVTVSLVQGSDNLTLFLNKEQAEHLFGSLNNYFAEQQAQYAYAEARALAEYDARRDDEPEGISLA